MFIDEPGDHQSSLPYGSLTGVALKDTYVWELVKKLNKTHEHYATLCQENNVPFGSVFSVQSDLTESLIGKSGNNAMPLHKLHIEYFKFCLDLLRDYEAILFAIVIPRKDLRLRLDRQLRKDYSFLFERYFHFLNSHHDNQIGYLIRSKYNNESRCVDELQIRDYFNNTTKGRLRSRLIMPEILSCDGSMSVLVHVSRIITFVVSQSVRMSGMDIPVNTSLLEVANLCNKLRFSYVADNGKKDWSFKFVSDLSPMPVLIKR